MVKLKKKGIEIFDKLLKYKTFTILAIISLLVVGFCFTDSSNSTKANNKVKGKSIRPFRPKIELQWDQKLSPEIDKWFKKLYSTTRFNGDILVGKGGKIIYENYAGWANFKYKDTLSLERRFQVGSVSKIFTATAIMILKERNLLSYDDLVEKYIKGFPYKGVTIRQLLSHRSGLPNYNYFCDAYTDRETVVYNKDVVKLMIDSIPAAYYQPNERFDYCNTNFVLLAYIVEKISGRPFADFMRDEVFNKAGMCNTRIYINGKQARISDVATGYLFPWTVALPTYQDGVSGDKDVFTTVEDLWLWNRALDSNLVIKRETLEESFRPGSPEKKGIKNYGLGWRLKTAIDGSKIVYHTGWWRGFNAMFVKDLKNDAVFIILSNIRTRALYGMFPELLGVVDPKRRQMQLESDSLYQKAIEGAKDTVNLELEL
jgi:CubicO group peptidase (beta-lactamase class C family)